MSRQQQSNRNTRSNNRRSQTNQENEGYFDLKITGLGYVNNLKENKSKKEKLFTSCTIAALVGPKETDQREYRYFNVVVHGEQTLDLLWDYEDDIANERKVMIKFCLNDIKTFAYEKDNGDLGASLRSSLYAIEKIWVDGKLTYESPKPQTQTDEQAPAPSEKSQRTGRSSNRNTSQRQSGRSTRAA